MALRLLTLVVDLEADARLSELLEEQPLERSWRERDEHHVKFHALVEAEKVEALFDRLEDAFQADPRFLLVVVPVEAARPHPRQVEEEEAEKAEAKAASNGGEESEATPVEPDAGDEASEVVAAAAGLLPLERVSRDELYDKAWSGAALGRNYLFLVVLSAIVAAAGLLRDDIAIIIGAMVIAPMLSPNIALALATTIGDPALGRKAVLTNAVGVAVCLAVALLIGVSVPIDVSVPAIAARSQVALSDLAIALCAGAAGALAFTAGQSGAVIGVMVAVALVPPLVVCGMLLGAGAWEHAGYAGMLVAANVICVNLAAVAVFLLQGLSPRYWWQKRKVSRSIWRMVALWAGLLAALAVVIALSR